MTERIWDGIYPVRILKPKLEKFNFAQIAMLVVSNVILFYCSWPIQHIESRLKKLKIYFLFYRPPDLSKMAREKKENQKIKLPWLYMSGAKEHRYLHVQEAWRKAHWMDIVVKANVGSADLCSYHWFILKSWKLVFTWDSMHSLFVKPKICVDFQLKVLRNLHVSMHNS